MPNSVTFSVNVSGSTPLTGSSGSFSIWSKDVSGSISLPTPVITELGSGQYQFTPTAQQEEDRTVVHIDCGVGRDPRRYTFACFESSGINQFFAWHLEDVDQNLWSGANPSRSLYCDTSGSARPTPTELLIDTGVYAVLPSVSDITMDVSGKYDSPAGAVPEYTVIQCSPTVYGASGPPSPPEISNFIPATGSQITRQQMLQFDVTDFNGFTRILLRATYPNLGVSEVIHDGYQFGYHYSNVGNTFMQIIDGYRYTVLRDGGWPESPIITPFAIDIDGTENL